MARTVGDDKSAEQYRTLFQSGSAWADAHLWNGDYYEQKVNIDRDAASIWPKRYLDKYLERGRDDFFSWWPKWQVGKGCLSDQMIGQWYAEMLGLGYLFDRHKVRRALQSVFRHNWRSDLSDHPGLERLYALNDEAGLLVCTWPLGGRPGYPPLWRRGLVRHRIPGREPSDLRMVCRRGAGHCQGCPRPPSRRSQEPLGRVRVRPPLRSVDVELRTAARVGRLPLLGTSRHDRLRAAHLRRGLRDSLLRGERLGNLPSDSRQREGDALAPDSPWGTDDPPSHDPAGGPEMARVGVMLGDTARTVRMEHGAVVLDEPVVVREGETLHIALTS